MRLARNEKENIQYGSIDIMSERELAVRFRLHHDPTLILVHNVWLFILYDFRVILQNLKRNDNMS